MQCQRYLMPKVEKQYSYTWLKLTYNEQGHLHGQLQLRMLLSSVDRQLKLQAVSGWDCQAAGTLGN